MQEAYGLSMGTLPNAMPMREALQPPAAKVANDARIEFLFLGVFASGRGIQPLIRAWPQTPKNCVLVLQGPDGDYKRLMMAEARQLGADAARIEFPYAISEDQLVVRASNADVGVIPYEPTLLNHLFCSPNKLSQYMAAGLPILANTTSFVAQILKRADCGIIVDLENAEGVGRAVSRLAQDVDFRKRLGKNARKGFEAFFNWEAFAPGLLNEVKDAAYNGTPSPSDSKSALDSAFRATFEGVDGPELPLAARLARKAKRLVLKGIWHGVPFLRMIVLSNSKFRRQAEKLRK
jgi:glycosyltransferase involved in cell wall biosynthesis